MGSIGSEKGLTMLCILCYRHIEYCMHRVNLLRHYGVKPILVFDGGLLPMKGDQENKRARYILLYDLWSISWF